jgi:hypothetical protein
MVAACTVVLAVMMASVAADKFFYVATNGSDSNPGTFSSPFATPRGAQAAIRAMKKAGPLTEPITVWIEDGEYPLMHSDPVGTLVFTSEDSGAPSTPITYIASGEPGAVILSGGRRVEGWTFLGGALMFAFLFYCLNLSISPVLFAHIPGGLWSAPWPEDALPFHQLWADGARQVPARTPVHEYVSAGLNFLNYGTAISGIPHNSQVGPLSSCHHVLHCRFFHLQ